MPKAFLGPNFQNYSSVLGGFRDTQSLIDIVHRAAVDLCDDVAGVQASFAGGRVLSHVMDKDALKIARKRQLSPHENVQIANDSAGECFG
jgi:hypothetical protein